MSSNRKKKRFKNIYIYISLILHITYMIFEYHYLYLNIHTMCCIIGYQ